DEAARFPRLMRVFGPLLGPLAPLIGGVRVPMRWIVDMKKIANDPELAHLICDDALGGGNKAPLRFLHSTLAIRPAIEPEDFDLCPVLLAQPAADPWTTIEASRPFFDRIKGPKEL